MAGTLAGRVALVTGASSGIGAAAASALAEAGASVAVCARRTDRLQALVGRIEAAGGTALALPGDVADETVATGIVEAADRHFGRLDILVNAAGVIQAGGVEHADTRLDILVNAAGVIQAGGVEHADTAQWRRVIDINLLSILYTCKAAIAPIKARGGGDIVNISSTAGRRVAGVFGPYSTSKFGLTALTEGLRQEVGKAGIRVCLIEPGATTTEVSAGVTDPVFKELVRQHVSREGAMKPEDVAAAIVFVVSLPPRANVSELLIRPTTDTAPL
jgi:NADP-dependent 3-hydroxy acid dehydrogenase YdfG